MFTAAGCDLPISWAFPTVSGLAGARWFTLPHCCLPRTHGQLPASCLPLCVLALPSRLLPRRCCQKPSFWKVKQPQVTYANICVFFLILLCSTWKKMHKWTRRKWNLGSLWISWIKQQNPKNPLACRGMMILVEFYLKLCEVWSSAKWFNVDLDLVCFLGFAVHMWFLAEAESWCMAGRVRKVDIGLGLKTTFCLFF